MKHYKVYGNENTKLKLTDKARIGYQDSSIDILEYDNGTYSLFEEGANYNSNYRLIASGLPANDVNVYFEEIVDSWAED